MRHLKVLDADPNPLDRLEIATPCDVPWDSLKGDHRVRHCGKCRQSVYNIEAMGRAEAMRLIAAREGRLCLRIFRRIDGTVVTADCWARLRAARQRGFLAFAAMLVVVAWVELAAVLFGLWNLRRVVVGGQMGDMTPATIPTAPIPREPLPLPPPMELMGKPSPPEMGDLLGEMTPDPELLDKQPRPKKPKAVQHRMGRIRVR